MPSSVEDAIILIDAQLLDAPTPIGDDWRRVRGHLRRNRRPSSTNMPAVDPDDVPTGKHFQLATKILQKAGSEPPK
jgi:hypothetical protein